MGKNCSLPENRERELFRWYDREERKREGRSGAERARGVRCSSGEGASMTVFHRVTEGKLGSREGCAIEDEVSQEFLDRIPGGLFRYRADDDGGSIDYVSRDVLTMFGCATYEEFCAITANTFIGMVHPDDRQRVTDDITAQIKQGNTDAVTYRLNRPDGAEVWVDDRGRYVVDTDGQAWFYVTIIDITEKMSYQRKLERAEERVEMLTVLSRDVIFDIDCQEQTGELFGDFEARFGRAPQSEDLILRKRCDRECSIELEVHDIDPVREVVDRGDFIDMETSLANVDGDPIWCRYQSFVLFNDAGCPVRHVGRLLDTHDMVMREATLRKKAELDGLTGIFNREAAMVRITKALAGEDCAHGCSLFLVDVDNFKQVNDGFGHPEGDRVLQEIAKFLSRNMRKDDIVARLGGDEFAIFAAGLGPGPALDRVLAQLSGGIYANGGRPADMPADLHPSITIGAAACMRTGVTFDDLYQVADEALYVAKRAGKSRATLRQLD